jgi:hypothetical protein
MAGSPFESSPPPAAVERALQELRASMRSGFEGLSKRMDDTNEYLRELNGRTRKNEDSLARHDERLKTLFRERRHHELFHTNGRGERERERERDRDDEEDEKETGSFTMRDGKMLIAGIVGTVAVLTFLGKVLPLALKALQP